MADSSKPVATALPEAPPSDFFTETQWDVFYAILDGVLPSIVPQAAGAADDGSALVMPQDEFKRLLDEAAGILHELPPPPRETLAAYMGQRSADEAAFRLDCLRLLAMTPARHKLAKLLNFLNTRAGSLFLTGYWSPITAQPTRVRHAIVQSWARSNLPVIKGLGKTFSAMAHRAFVHTSPLFRELSGYTDVPRDWKAGKDYDFSFIQVQPGGDVHVIETDVVIVGSGCGGGVAAKNLAEAGHGVLVVDKGYYFPPSQLPMAQDVACQYLFDNGSVYMSENASTSVLAGGAWGGGGTVNWSVCLRTQDYVRKEWADGGLPMFTSTAYDECMDRVWDFAGAGTDGVRHNHRNRVLLDGSRALGWAAAEAPQNTAGKPHDCGQCHLGCGSAGKRGPAVSWLPAAGDAGAQFMEGFRIDRVTFGEDATTATGVEGQWTSRGPGGSVDAPLSARVQRRVRIRAKKVIVSAGTLWSPVVLMESGITLGKNLHLHPASMVTAVFEHDEKPWEGGIITAYNSEFENLDGKGHGVKLEPTCMVPYTMLSQYPWTSGAQAKLNFLKFRRLASFISLTRDRDTGSVFRDAKTGAPRIDYSASEFDRANAIEGVQAIAKLCYLGGATEIQPYQLGLDPFERTREEAQATLTATSAQDPEFADRRFAAWLGRVRAVGNEPPAGVFASAHQMGTCRMAADEARGVVDEKGRVWGRTGLYVADASVFPSASGVNPMITTMAIADWVSRGVDEDLRG